jgi:hypothetical protein
MKFTEGNTISAGRPKGSQNKTAKNIRLSIEDFIQNNISSFQTHFDSLKPKEKVDTMIGLIKIVVPALQSIEHKDTTENKGFTPLEVSFKNN